MWYSSGGGMCFANITLPTLKSFINPVSLKFGDYTYNSSVNTWHAANYIYYYKIVVETTCVASKLKVYFPSSEKPTSGSIRCALYSESSNLPATLLTVSDVALWTGIIGDEWTTFYVNSDTELTPGNYWIGTWSSVNYKKGRTAGGSNNWCIQAITYTGIFPSNTGTLISDVFNDVDVYMESKSLWAKDDNVYNTDLASEPTRVYFNNVQGNRKTSLENVTSEYDWYYLSGQVYIYSIERPEIRYQITYD
jgi:hypothetical protein